MLEGSINQLSVDMKTSLKINLNFNLMKLFHYFKGFCKVCMHCIFLKNVE